LRFSRLKYLLWSFLVPVTLFSFFTVSAQQKVLDSLKLVLKNARHDTVRCAILNSITETVFEFDPDSALRVSFRAEKLALTNLKTLDKKDKTYRSFLWKLEASLLNSAAINKTLSNYKSAIDLFERSIEVDKELNNELEVGESLAALGEIHFIQGHTDKAIDCFTRSLSIMRKFGNKMKEAKDLLHIGNVYVNKGEAATGINYFQQALKIFEKIGDKTGIGTVLGNLGFIYTEQNDLDKAIEYFLKAVTISEEVNDVRGTGSNYNNLGTVYYRKGDTAKCLLYFEKSLAKRTQLGDKVQMANSLTNIGNVYLNQFKLKEAKEYFERSLKIREEAGDSEGMFFSFLNLGHLYSKNNDKAKALVAYDRASRICKELGYPRLQVIISEQLYIYHKHIGDPKRALENYELFIKTRDSVNSESNRKAAIRSQLKYEYEKQAAADSVAHAKENEIKSAELSRQSAEIKAKKNQQVALFGGLGLVIIFAGFMYNRFKVTQKQKDLIEHQKEIVDDQKKLVEEKQKEILDSIKYARRIQMALIPSEKRVQIVLTRLKS
jgi:tetratricopeptide (TPR) repeat protein